MTLFPPAREEGSRATMGRARFTKNHPPFSRAVYLHQATIVARLAVATCR
jgi:hypothetical protein